MGSLEEIDHKALLFKYGPDRKFTLESYEKGRFVYYGDFDDSETGKQTIYLKSEDFLYYQSYARRVYSNVCLYPEMTLLEMLKEGDIWEEIWATADKHEYYKELYRFAVIKGE